MFFSIASLIYFESSILNLLCNDILLGENLSFIHSFLCNEYLPVVVNKFSRSYRKSTSKQVNCIRQIFGEISLDRYYIYYTIQLNKHEIQSNIHYLK